MTVVIKPIEPLNFPLRVAEIEDGKAYLSEYGRVYIGNMIGCISAFSLDGIDVIGEGSNTRFREIKLTCEVEEI